MFRVPHLRSRHSLIDKKLCASLDCWRARGLATPIKDVFLFAGVNGEYKLGLLAARNNRFYN